MDDSTEPPDTQIQDPGDENYAQLKGLSKEWRKRYRHAHQQREELETLLTRLENERQVAKMEKEEMEEKCRRELEEEKKALELQTGQAIARGRFLPTMYFAIG
uniref:Uncharacterized protein n=1 Tax=Branchiostoma floridae TaxID=7739 RepID=C3XTQ1_BRAFL|eukprot:XP_002612668.1 hypothetical protein BRAFLDRAFT_78701 [Branchiostoma floridae]